jgi:hypothetical protein
MMKISARASKGLARGEGRGENKNKKTDFLSTLRSTVYPIWYQMLRLVWQKRGGKKKEENKAVEGEANRKYIYYATQQTV